MELVEGSISVDHVHMYVKIPPKLSVSEFMGISKEKAHTWYLIAFLNETRELRGSIYLIRWALLNAGHICSHGKEGR